MSETKTRRAAALVKQVPDLRRGHVRTRPDGTLDRGSAPTIVNPADLHALEAACRLADEVVAITMGPPAAEAAGRDAIAQGAHSAVLVTDRRFAGSDTWATANVLASAIVHLGPFDLVVCGLSALDGETGQVGPQVAERLGIPHVTGVEKASWAGERLHVRRVVEGGFEELVSSTPAVLTIAETGFQPRYPTLPSRRRAAAAKIPHLGAQDLGMEPDRAGLQASPTRVASMDNVPLPSHGTRFVGTDLTYEELAVILRAAASKTVMEHDPSPARSHTPATVPARPGAADLWVVCEAIDGHLGATSAELLSKADDLAEALGTGVAAVLIGADMEDAVTEVSRHGADLVLVADDARLAPYRVLPHARVLADAITDHRPDVVLLGATSTGRELAARVAARSDTGLAADCTDLAIADWNHRGRVYRKLLHQIRPAMGQSVRATCLCPEARPQMATVRPGAFRAVARPKLSRRERLRTDVQPRDEAVEVIARHVQPRAVALEKASVVVSGGAGCGGDRWKLVEDLATALGGQVGASRAAVDAGLASRARQVGQTGASVAPDLYIACGISGTLQHVVGIKAAKTVVAVNRDPDATIFRFAHYAVVEDVAVALPRLTEALNS